MAYENTTKIISRRGPSDLSGTLSKLWSTVETGVKSAVNFYGQAQKDAGAAAALNAQAAAAQSQVVQYAQPASTIAGFPTTTVVLLGGAALLAVVLLRKKS